ncbi:MAG: MoaD/ThiS family protein [Promethearchaeota archaeon]
MTIKLKLYGDLREKIIQSIYSIGIPSSIDIKIEGISTVLDLLNKFGIIKEEISHIFVNNIYSTPKKEIKDGDRIGVFPKRMGLIFVEIKNPL